MGLRAHCYRTEIGHNMRPIEHPFGGGRTREDKDTVSPFFEFIQWTKQRRREVTGAMHFWSYCKQLVVVDYLHFDQIHEQNNTLGGVDMISRSGRVSDAERIRRHG